MAIEHKFVSVNNKSNTNGIGNTDTNVFRSSNHSGSADITYVSDYGGANTFDSSTGEITVGDSGNYYIIFSCFVDVLGTSDRNPILKIKIDDTTVSQFTFKFEAATGAVHKNGTEKTVTYFGTINSNSKVTATLASSDAVADVVSEKGTVLSLFRAADSYAVATRIGGITYPVGEVNQFISGTLNTDYIIKNSSDFSVSGANNNFKFDSPGNTKLFYLSANYLLSQSASSNATIVNRIYKNDSTILSGNTQMIVTTGAGNNPYETNCGILQQLSDTNTTRATVQDPQGVNLLSGSSYTVMEVNDENYCSIRTTSNSSNIGIGSSSILLNSGSEVVPSGIINYNSTSGSFTVGADGYYFISSNLIFMSATSNDGDSVNLTIRKNNTSCNDGTILFDSNCRVEGSGDPLEITLTGIYSLNANDRVSVCALNTAGNTAAIYTRDGSTFTIFKLGSLTGGGGGGGDGGGGTIRISTFGGGSGGFSIGSFGSPTSGRTVGNGFF